ncbi:MAG: acylneuraminate cytidylyltransferase [Planctomycetes bacterium]|nr:acylneuraminate cytidylyltransferase [Planctomycetota bacterium]
MKRKLIAALACRVQGERLYGKPVQNLVKGKTILDQILDTVERLPGIETSVLGISEGIENQVFVKIAKRRGIPYIFGDEIDVLSRLIQCAHITAATDVYRVTTECPFTHFEPFERAWSSHVEKGNDVTVCDGVPEGTAFEIYRLQALLTSHERGTQHHRSEGCSRYVREHLGEFQVEVISPEPACARSDLRLTVDYPEDLALCRRVYEHFREQAPLIPLREIVQFLDARPELKALVASYVDTRRIWPENP